MTAAQPPPPIKDGGVGGEEEREEREDKEDKEEEREEDPLEEGEEGMEEGLDDALLLALVLQFGPNGQEIPKWLTDLF